MNVIVLRKVLQAPPSPGEGPEVVVARLAVPNDAPAWLALHQHAFAGEEPSVRPWTHSDFLREMGGGRRISWLARASADAACGAISLTLPSPPGVPASLHWLMVDPTWRRRGVGSLLLGMAERHCWQQGCRELRLETHRDWNAALQFYQRHGFR